MDKVDIAYNHLLNWVCARGNLPNDYAIKLLNLEDYCKVNILNDQKLPENIKAIFHKTNDEYTEWYDPLTRAFEELKQTEEGKKVNFIGQYTFEPMQKINKVLKNFNKHNLYLVSYYQLLHKYITYYLPYLKKNLASTTSELNDYKVKEGDSVKKFKNLSVEFENKLKKYDLNVDNYPFKDEYQSLLFYDIQEKLVASSTEFLKKSYEKVVETLNRIHDPIINMLETFNKFQKMENTYSVEDSTKFIRHCKQHGLESYKLAESLHESIMTHSTGYDPNLSNDVIEIDEKVKVDDVIFNSFLGNNLCRQLLLSDLHEVVIFMSIREHELRKTEVPNFFNTEVELNFSLDDYVHYKNELNDVIELLMGNEAVRVQNMLKNHQKLSECVMVEMSAWTLAMNELSKQDSYSFQIKMLENNLKKLKGELETVKANIKELKNKLEQRVSTLSKVKVHIFGEIDVI